MRKYPWSVTTHQMKQYMAEIEGLGHHHALCIRQANRQAPVCLLPDRRIEASRVMHIAGRKYHNWGRWGQRAMDQPELRGWLVR